MEVEYLCLGQRIPEWKTGVDGCVMEYQQVSGLTLLYMLKKPNIMERRAFNSSQPFQIAFTSILDVGFFCIKVGNMEWSDCAFSPCIYDEHPILEPLEPGKGYALNMLLIDSANGEIMDIRMIGLGHEFCKKFREWFMEAQTKLISREQYQKTVNMVMRRYTTQELVNRAWIKWSL